MTEDASNEEGGRVRPFADVLLDLNRGRTHDELSIRMQDLVAAVLETGKKGSVTLTIAVAKSKASGQVEITDDVRVKAPAADRAASIFFVTDNHNLTREDPHQQRLPLREVPDSTDTTSTEKKLREAK